MQSDVSQADENAYLRLLPPDLLLGLDVALVPEDRRPDVEDATHAWVELSEASVAGLGHPPATDVAQDLAALTELWSDPWAALDPNDTPAVDAVVALPIAALVAQQQLRVDQASRRAIGAFLAEVGAPDDHALAPAAVALLAGLWGGSLRAPRLPMEWQAAEAVGDIRVMTSIASTRDVASARALLLARTSPLYSHPEAWSRLVTWAYGRAAGWPQFQSPDPELHRRLLASVADDTAPPHVEDSPMWPPEIVTIVTAGKIPEPEPEIVVPQRAVELPDLLAELDALVGMDEVKKEVRAWVDLERMEQLHRENGGKHQPITRHMVLTGNPGTGKTTVARLIARIYKALGVLSRGTVLEVQRSDLVGGVVGETEHKTQAAIESATGGVLFIDEAYSLALDSNKDYGHVAINVLVSEMENRRDSLVVIAAGYPAPMHKFLEANPGLASRFPRHVRFPDLSDAALVQVYAQQAESAGYVLDAGVLKAVSAHVRAIPRGQGFGNARFARNLFDVTRQRLAVRWGAAPDDVDAHLITVQDVPVSGLPGKVDEERLASALARLDSLAGLTKVKNEVHSMVAHARLTQHKVAKGLSGAAPLAPHMVFLGPPGTGKTVVAGIMAEILAGLGMLDSGHVVKASKGQLVAQYLGQTAPLVISRVREAKGGVLFIDEAYSLNDSGFHHNYGEEAIATLVEQMEMHRGEFSAILAGYTDAMDAMLDMNEGLRSRISLSLAFEPYDEEQLTEIAQRMARERKLRLGPGAAERIARLAWVQREKPGYANARTVRNVVEAAEKALATRLQSRLGRASLPDEALVTIELADLPEPVDPDKAFGFAP